MDSSDDGGVSTDCEEEQAQPQQLQAQRLTPSGIPPDSDDGSVASEPAGRLGAKSKGKAKCKGKAKSKAKAKSMKKSSVTLATGGEQLESEPEIPASAWQRARELGRQVVAAAQGTRLVIEIFAGCCRFSGACAEKGLALFVPIEKDLGAWANVANPVVQAVILTAIASGLIWYVHLATPCTPWSKARTTSRKPPSMAEVWFTKKVLEAARKNNVYWSLENPYGSGLFDFPPIAEELRKFSSLPVPGGADLPAPGGGSAVDAQAPVTGGGSTVDAQAPVTGGGSPVDARAPATGGEATSASGAIQVRYECCAWGATFQKKSELRTNFPPLQELGKRCKERPAKKASLCQQL